MVVTLYVNVAECGMGDFPYIPFWDFFSDKRFWAMRLYAHLLMNEQKHTQYKYMSQSKDQ